MQGLKKTTVCKGIIRKAIFCKAIWSLLLFLLP